jgi:ribose transport system permease protein
MESDMADNITTASAVDADDSAVRLVETELAASAAPAPHRGRRSPSTMLGFDRFSGLYVWAIVIVLFSLWVPSLFATSANFRLVANEQAITALVAMALIIPLAAGVFDLSFAATMGMSLMVDAYLQHHGWNALLASVIAVLLGGVIGALNGVGVTVLHVDSFITTLGMSSILAAGTYWVSGGFPIQTGISSGLKTLGTKQWGGLSVVFFILIVVAIMLYVVMEYTPSGRYLFAVGGNPIAARLAGLRVDRIIFSSLVACGALSGFAGVLLLGQLGIASYDVGPPYLLPAFSAAFLGATQIKAGRVNVWGTVIAVYLLATGVNGLQLAGAPSYINNLFQGVALIVAVALAVRTARRRVT